MENINWMLVDDCVSVVMEDGSLVTVCKDEKPALFDSVLMAIKDNDFERVFSLLDNKKAFREFSDGLITFDGVNLLIDSSPVPRALGEMIVKFKNDGLPYEPLIKFWNKLKNNPSYRAVQSLYDFLEANKHPITSDGNFIAYKRIRKTFKDIYSDSFDNTPGSKVKMPRNMVNEDPTQTCSHGLHVANWDYAKNHFGGANGERLIMVTVDPANVVAVPIDYNGSKMRVCEYEVLKEIESEFKDSTLYREHTFNGEDDYPYDDDSLYDDDNYLDEDNEDNY